jgi:hypothetical protein
MPVWLRGSSCGLARPITHPADIGALPVVRAAVGPAMAGGSYVWPDGWQEFTGYPVLLRPGERACDPELQLRLWQESERLTDVSYQFSIARL